MSLSTREFWGVIHGVILGGAFLLAFTGGLVGLYSMKPEWLTSEGLRDLANKLKSGTWIMAVVA